MTEIHGFCDEAFTPWELARHRNPWMPALSPADEADVRRRFRRDGNRSNAAALAREYRVTTRTIYRTLTRPVVSLPCPGDRCQTITPGGRLCHYCRRSA